MTDSYYNTTGATGALLTEYETAATSQEQLIRDYFRTRPGMMYSPSQVQRHLGLLATPLTSIRRAMTNLTTANLLIKLDKQTTGPYGRPEHVWQLRRDVDDDQMTLF